MLGQPALTRVGVLVLALPLRHRRRRSGRSRYRLALVRTVNPQLVAAGQPARVNLTLTNEGRTPSGRAAARGPRPLRARHPAAVRARRASATAGAATSTYQVRSDVRGRFEIGPMTVRVSDPFGLVELAARSAPRCR